MRVINLFGIKYPKTLAGGCDGVARAELSSAASKAGGLGILSALTFLL